MISGSHFYRVYWAVLPDYSPLEELMCCMLSNLLQEDAVAKLANDLYCGGNSIITGTGYVPHMPVCHENCYLPQNNQSSSMDMYAGQITQLLLLHSYTVYIHLSEKR